MSECFMLFTSMPNARLTLQPRVTVCHPEPVRSLEARRNRNLTAKTPAASHDQVYALLFLRLVTRFHGRARTSGDRLAVGGHCRCHDPAVPRRANQPLSCLVSRRFPSQRFSDFHQSFIQIMSGGCCGVLLQVEGYSCSMPDKNDNV